LPDGNKRVAFLLMARFLDANGISWGSADPDTDTPMVERIASSAATHDETVIWIRARATDSAP
jgi:prophage maintenance system killer protein